MMKILRRSGPIVDESLNIEEETHLTVQKTSMFVAGDGFSVYDSKGEVVYRVDSYGLDASNRDEFVLMNSAGKCLLTVHRKRSSLHHRWEGYLGERTERQNPFFSVASASMMGRSSTTVEVYVNPIEEYHIDGSFAQRCCTIFGPSHNSSTSNSTEVVAEIKRKGDEPADVVYGKDVFTLSLKPGFDGAFAMGLIMVLDQISDYIDDGDQEEVGDSKNDDDS